MSSNDDFFINISHKTSSHCDNMVENEAPVNFYMTDGTVVVPVVGPPRISILAIGTTIF